MDDQNVNNNPNTEQPQIDQPQPESPVPVPVSNPTPAAPVVDQSPRSYLAIVVLAAFAGPFGLARWYRGDTTIGKTRFWVALGSTLTSWIPFVNFISIIGIVVMCVWAVIDFFMLHGTTSDANNQPYAASQRDINWAKWIKIYFTISISLFVVIFIIGIIAQISLTAYNSINEAARQTTYR